MATFLNFMSFSLQRTSQERSTFGYRKNPYMLLLFSLLLTVAKLYMYKVHFMMTYPIPVLKIWEYTVLNAISLFYINNYCTKTRFILILFSNYNVNLYVHDNFTLFQSYSKQ